MVEEQPFEEKSILHSKFSLLIRYLFFIFMFSVSDSHDYLGRSFLHIPQDVGVNLKSDSPPDKCFLPKSHVHTWQGHTKGIAAIKWFPRSAHLILSAGMDCRVKVVTNSLVEKKLNSFLALGGL